MPAGWKMGVSVGPAGGLLGTGVLVFCGRGVRVAAGCDVLVAAGCNVLVAAGCNVLVAAGCDVLVAAGCDVLVAAGCEGKFWASKVAVAAGTVAFSIGVLTTELFFGVNQLHPINTGSNMIKHRDKYKIAFRR